jgi:hypothetical protein
MTDKGSSPRQPRAHQVEVTQGARTVYDIIFSYGEDPDGSIYLWYLADYVLGVSPAEAMQWIKELDASGAARMWQGVNDDAIFGVRLASQPRVTSWIPLDIRLAVLERDGWLCHLCGLAIQQALRHPDPMSASLDHVIARADGGSHDWTNLRATHLACNVRRGRSPIESA